MEKSNFDQLLERYLTGRISEKEQKKLEAWLDVMKAEKGNDLDLSKEDAEKLFRKITSEMDNVEEVVHFRPGNFKPRPFFTRRWFYVAAAVFLMVTVAYGVFYMGQAGLLDLNGGRERLVLNDGTIVWLTKDSKLSYYEDDDNESRRATLTGEALFEVTKDPDRPFIIRCGEIKVKVIGTSFNVKTQGETLEIKVLTGKVNLSSAKDARGIDVSSREKVIYSTSGEVKRVDLSDPEIRDVTKSTEYEMLFSNTAMKVVFERIERKFGVAVSVEEDQLNKCRLTADFTDKSLEKTMSMISEMLDIEYTIEDKLVRVTGKGCN